MEMKNEVTYISKKEVVPDVNRLYLATELENDLVDTNSILQAGSKMKLGHYLGIRDIQRFLSHKGWHQKIHQCNNCAEEFTSEAILIKHKDMGCAQFFHHFTPRLAGKDTKFQRLCKTYKMSSSNLLRY